MNAKAAHSLLYEKGNAENAPAPAENFSVASQQSLGGRTLFSGYEPFHINHFSLSNTFHGFGEFGGHPVLLMFDNEKHHFGPDVPQPGPNLLDYFYNTHAVLRRVLDRFDSHRLQVVDSKALTSTKPGE
jgi:hypothetical protein